MGCTQPTGTTENVTLQPTTAPVLTAVTPMATLPTATPTTPASVEPTPEPEPTLEAIEPEWTEAPVVYPTAVMRTEGVNFTKYRAEEFMAEYPVGWTVTEEPFTLPSIELYGTDIWKPIGKMTTFLSEDKNVSMKVIMYDFITPGKQTYTPTVESARKSVATLFPNASADASVYNWEYKLNDQRVMVSSYDVLFSPSSEYYPYSYTEQTFITYNHMWNIDFIVWTGNLN